MSVQDGLEFDPARLPTARGGADTRLPPGIFDFDWDATSASAESAFQDVPGRDQQLRQAEVAAASAELAKLRGQPAGSYFVMMPGEPTGSVPYVDEAKFWRDLADTRRLRPDALSELGSDRADFEKRRRVREAASRQALAGRMSKGGLAGNLLGGVAGAFSDPINIMTLPVGGGAKTVAGSIVREALFNAGIEAVEQPLIAADRAQQGREMTWGEAGTNVALAGVGAAGLTAIGRGLGAGLGKAWDAAGGSDWEAARALRQSVKGDWELSPEQAAALHVLERAGEIDATNPFAGTYAALDTHARQVDQVLAAMARLPEASSSAPRLDPTPALSTDFGRAWAAIVGIEGGTNRDGSFRTSPAGAIGPAQVMPDTAPIAARLAGLPWDETRYRRDAQYNLALGQAYYREMLRQFDGDPVKAAAAYNAGPGSARRGTGVRGAMARAERAGRPADWAEFLPGETRAYVANFQRRTGNEPGATIAAGDAPDLTAVERPAALDADPVAVTPLTVREDVLQQALRPVLRDMVEAGGPSLNRLGELSADLGVEESQLRRALDHLVEGGDLTRTASGVYRRRAGSGPEDMLRFITRQGGLSYDGLDAAGRALGTKGHDLRNTGYLATMVPGGGPLLRPNGRGLDSMGELLWDAGFFGPPSVTPRPTDGELITLLDGAIRSRGKRYSVFDEAAPDPRETIDPAERGTQRGLLAGFQSEEHYRAERDAYDAVAQDLLGRPLDDAEFAAAHRIGAEEPALPGPDAFDPQARIAGDIREMVNRELDDVIERELTPADRDELEAEGLAGPVLVDEAAARSFDEPGGEGQAAEAESLWHDIRAKRGDDGDSATIGDTIDLGDGRGERPLAEIEKELADDAADIDTIEACLRDMGAAAA